MRKRAYMPIFILSLVLWFVIFTKLNDAFGKKRIAASENIRLLPRVSETTLLELKEEHKLLPDETVFNDTSSLYGKVRNSTYLHGGVTDNERTARYGSCISRIYPLHGADKPRRSYPYFSKVFEIERDPVKSWISESRTTEFCGGNIRLFDERFGVLHNVVLDSSKRVSANKKPKGGEPLATVLEQNEADEFYEYSKGFLKMDCDHDDVPTDSKISLVKYLDKVFDRNTDIINETTTDAIFETRFTLAVTRIDYVNLHNFVRQMYNAFLLMMVFKKQPNELSILFLDGHPTGMLDQPWVHIFGQVDRVGNFSKPVFYKNLILGLEESDGELTHFESDHLSYGEEFRLFFLREYHISHPNVLDCNRIVITLNLRRDKVFHPRNVRGMVGRKIFNEAEIIGDLLQNFPNACVQGVLMDSLPMRNQLEIISTTDIFIGMHGAGMVHAMFLPRHAAILEIFPKDFKKGRPWYICYEKIAKWRSLKYDSWENHDRANEMPYDYTILPRDIILGKTKGLMKSLCPKSSSLR